MGPDIMGYGNPETEKSKHVAFNMRDDMVWDSNTAAASQCGVAGGYVCLVDSNTNIGRWEDNGGV